MKIMEQKALVVKFAVELESFNEGYERRLLALMGFLRNTGKVEIRTAEEWR